MPSRTLPTFTRADVEARNSKTSCYVTIGSKVYDVTDFVADHPGGGDLILEYGGRDIEKILKDPTSHPHSEAAYEVLDESLVGFLQDDRATTSSTKSATNGFATEKHKLDDSIGSPAATDSDKSSDLSVNPRTGMSCEEDLSKETDASRDYKTHKFLDLNRPLLVQLWFSGFSKEFYLDQVHRPRHYRGGQSAPLFGNFLEPLSKTPWWLVPIVWLPTIAFGLWRASQGEGPKAVWGCFGTGLAIWSLVEYILHRFLFHLDYYLPDNRVGICLHFCLHGIHHYLPMDRYRLVMPPTLLVVIASPLWKLAHAICLNNWYKGTALFCGSLLGYVFYDLTHYFLHHDNLPFWFKQLKKYHLQHHFLDYENGFGVTSRFWDWVFGTELVTPPKAT